LFASIAAPKVDLERNAQCYFGQGLTYLMPIRAALETLRLPVRLPSKVLIACPGFPRNSLFYYAVDGNFEDGFNRMLLVADRADQLVSVELVDERPQNEKPSGGSDQGYHTYDFVETRTKAMNTMRINAHTSLSNSGTFENQGKTSVSSENWHVVRVDLSLIQPEQRRAGSVGASALKQRTRWYVPKPLAELIMATVQKATQK
jgi:hypothetical protein